jgi:hypothetical protein
MTETKYELPSGAALYIKESGFEVQLELFNAWLDCEKTIGGGKIVRDSIIGVTGLIQSSFDVNERFRRALTECFLTTDYKDKMFKKSFSTDLFAKNKAPIKDWLPALNKIFSVNVDPFLEAVSSE